MTPDRDLSTLFFSASAPAGDASLPGLLRAVADRLDKLGDVSVRDIVIAPAQHTVGVSLCTVYYSRGE